MAVFVFFFYGLHEEKKIIKYIIKNVRQRLTDIKQI